MFGIEVAGDTARKGHKWIGCPPRLVPIPHSHSWDEQVKSLLFSFIKPFFVLFKPAVKLASTSENRGHLIGESFFRPCHRIHPQAKQFPEYVSVEFFQQLIHFPHWSVPLQGEKV